MTESEREKRDGYYITRAQSLGLTSEQIQSIRTAAGAKDGAPVVICENDSSAPHVFLGSGYPGASPLDHYRYDYVEVGGKWIRDNLHKA